MTWAIPVIYYHSIGDHARPRPKSFLTLPRAAFESHLRQLQSWNVTSVFLDTVHDYVRGAASSEPAIALTFDDGFLDNWVIAFPLARRYNIKFTIFVNPEFVDPREIVRPTLEDVWEGRITDGELDWWGYLSWAEMRRMEASGLVDIQSHALTHTWYPVSAEVIDFHHPGDPYYWLVWNQQPATKPFWLTAYDERLVPYGTPVYQHGKSIPSRRYFPDQALVDQLTGYVQARGGADFFATTPNWKAELSAQVNQYRAQHGERGRVETEAEYRERLTREIADSKAAIETQLKKEVRFLCWPGGGDNPVAHEIARQAGYCATTKGTRLNRPGGDPARLHRVAAMYSARYPAWMNRTIQRLQIDRARGRRTPGTLALNAVRQIRKIV